MGRVNRGGAEREGIADAEGLHALIVARRSGRKQVRAVKHARVLIVSEVVASIKRMPGVLHPVDAADSLVLIAGCRNAVSDLAARVV